MGKHSPELHDESIVEDDGYRYIFRWSYRHPLTGAIIRPKNGRPFKIPVLRLK